MSKKRNEVSAVAAQGNVSDSSGAVATGAVKKRTRKTHDQIWHEGYVAGIRLCVELLLDVGVGREIIAAAFCDIPFPFTDDPGWAGLWAFEDWDDWVAVEESVDPDGDASTPFRESH
jgi:hypothetical protein